MPADHSHHLAEHARQRHHQTLHRAGQTLTDMADTGEPITVALLAKRAGVSRSWIYSQPALRDKIQQLRRHQVAADATRHTVTRASDDSLRQRLALAHERIMAGSSPMIDEFAKEYLHGDLREIREAMLWKLDGLSEYDIRRPLTSTGTNLLGLIKHLSTWEARYFGEVFDRPFPEPLPRWDDAAEYGADLWATEDETREEIIDRYRRVWEHSDATIHALDIDAPGHVPWWPRPNVKLFNILVHILTETNRHAGHADILREQLDGKTGTAAEYSNPQERDTAFWDDHCAKIERAAKAAASGKA